MNTQNVMEVMHNTKTNCEIFVGQNVFVFMLILQGVMGAKSSGCQQIERGKMGNEMLVDKSGELWVKNEENVVAKSAKGKGQKF